MSEAKSAREIWTEQYTRGNDNRVRDDANYVFWGGDSVREIVIAFSEPELQSLYEYVVCLCHDITVIDSNLFPVEKVKIPHQSWAQNIVKGIVECATSEEDPLDLKFAVGTKVRRADGITGLATQNGEVILNYAWVDSVVNLDEYELPEYFDKERMRDLSQLVFVRWSYPEGSEYDSGVIAQGWHTPEQLEEIK
jgi:hypothetical protein